MKHLLLSIFFFSCIATYAQNIKKSADCKNAVDIGVLATDFLPAPEGFGEVREIDGNTLRNRFFFTEEHNSYWFTVKFNKDTEFEMILTPEYADDDYDFLVFKDTINLCEAIKTKEVLPVRSNMSRINPEDGSLTGLKRGAKKEYEVAGRGDDFSKPLQAKADEKYYIVIDAPYGSEGGIKVETFYDGKNQMGETLEDRQSKIIQKRSDKSRQTQIHKMKIEVRSQKDSSIVEDIDMTLLGLLPEDEVSYTNGQYVVSRVHHFRTYKGRIDKEGYKQLKFEYHHSLNQDTTLRFYLEKLKKGTKLSFNNIEFMPNSAQIMQSSLSDLEDMKNFLLNNEHISVEIMGHVNGVGGKKRKQVKLSKKRAKSVYEYLVAYGIGEERLTYHGYGGSMMVYPSPKNEMQAQANRRVDIKVTAINK